MTSSGASETDSARNRTSGCGADRRDHRLAAAVGQVHVEQHDVGARSRDQLDGGAAPRRPRPRPRPRRRARPGPRRGRGVVVDQERARSCRVRSGRGVVARPRARGQAQRHLGARRRPGVARRRCRRGGACGPGWTRRSPGGPRARVGVEAPAPVAHEHRDLGRLDLDEERDDAAPDHLAALTVASRAAASSARRSSSSGQSPTVTASTATPWAGLDVPLDQPPPPPPGSRPRRGATRGHALEQPRPQLPLLGPGELRHLGVLGVRWISARVWRTESCTRAAMSARSSARRGPALGHEVTGEAEPPRPEEHHEGPDHQHRPHARGPARPGSRARRPARARPATASAKPTRTRARNERRRAVRGGADVGEGGQARRSRARSAASLVAADQDQPGRGQHQAPGQRGHEPDAQGRAKIPMTTSSGTQPTARAMPRRSWPPGRRCLGLALARDDEPQHDVGGGAEAAGERAAPGRRSARSVGSIPKRRARPPATPPKSRSSRVRRGGVVTAPKGWPWRRHWPGPHSGPSRHGAAVPARGRPEVPDGAAGPGAGRWAVPVDGERVSTGSADTRMIAPGEPLGIRGIPEGEGAPPGVLGVIPDTPKATTGPPSMDHGRRADPAPTGPPSATAAAKLRRPDAGRRGGRRRPATSASTSTWCASPSWP